jgi:hypothetical protein
MGFPEYLASNAPPKPLVGWTMRYFGIEPIDNEDPGLWFAVTCASAFINWLKQDDGTMWVYACNGVRRITPGPWDIFTCVEGHRRRTLNSNIIFAWDRVKPAKSTGPVKGAAEHIRHVLRSHKVAVPMKVVEGLNLPPDTTQQEFQAKVALVGSMAVAGWFDTEDGHMWAFDTQGIIRAVVDTQCRVYSEHLVPILAPRRIEHTRKQATDDCEECSISQPCVKMERSGRMCRRCAGYSPDVYSNDGHSVCARCDITDCHHWKDLFQGHEKQEWLLNVR